MYRFTGINVYGFAVIIECRFTGIIVYLDSLE